MKTQISRDSFDGAKRYSGVYLQQGRMIVDADLNELTDIVKARLEGALADAVGSGAPRVGALAIAKNGPDGTDFVIQPGRVYADGVPARLDAAGPIALTAQPDYRNPPTLPARDFRLYADVWERPVSALEDHTLQDAGLHGADTATRSKTMLQVKWCDRTIDPLDPAGPNPRCGNALLTLKLRLITAGADPCDPCAAEVAIDERIGNYLFRVEVHDVFTEADQTHVVLKWSRDNGAEAYASSAYPSDFDQGAWVWEFFDSDSENLLGHHFPAGQRRRRGEIRTTFTKPATPLPNAFVRQWDGYAELNLSTGALVTGRDRGVDLSTGLTDTAHAFVKIDGGAETVQINLELLELTLTCGDKRFVAGDYWQVAVREAIDTSGQVVLGAAGAEPPRGILHHYVALADVDEGANLVAFTDAVKRRMSFPPLTDVQARDVGFTNACSDVYGAAENVQQALDALCGIGAEHIGYTVPACGTTDAPSVGTLLASLSGFPNRDDRPKSPSVKDILDYLMCDLNAARLPYNGNLEPRWTAINEGGTPLTVQDALDILCRAAGHGCAIAVAEGELESRLRDFANSSDVHDIALCLLPGRHQIGNEGISVPGSIRITGAPGASEIHLLGEITSFRASAIVLEDLAISLEGGAQLQLDAAHVSSVRCQYKRMGIGRSLVPGVRIGGKATRVLWQHNVMRDEWLTPQMGPEPQLGGVNVALGLSSHLTSATLTSNEIFGDVLLMNQLEPTAANDAATNVDSVVRGFELVRSGGGQLTIENNRIDRLWTLMLSPSRRPITTPIDGYAVCTLQGNHIIGPHNAVVARKLALHANHFDGDPGSGDFLGRMFVNFFTAVGNTSTDSTSAVEMFSSVPGHTTSNYFTVRQF